MIAESYLRQVAWCPGNCLSADTRCRAASAPEAEQSHCIIYLENMYVYVCVCV